MTFRRNRCRLTGKVMYWFTPIRYILRTICSDCGHEITKTPRTPGFIRPQRVHHFLPAHFGSSTHNDHQVERRLPVKHKHRTDRIRALHTRIQVIQGKSHGLAQDEVLRHD